MLREREERRKSDASRDTAEARLLSERELRTEVESKLKNVLDSAKDREKRLAAEMAARETAEQALRQERETGKRGPAAGGGAWAPLLQILCVY